MPRPSIGPDESFEESVDRNMDVEGVPCDFVGCPRPVNGYFELRQNQWRYYFYWRSKLRRGEPIKTDYGYVRLRLSEMFVRGDPTDNLREMRLMLKCCRAGSNEFDTILSAMCDYCIINGLDVKGCIPRDEVQRSVIIGEILRGNFEVIDPEQIDIMTTEYLPDEIDDTETYVISKALHALDEDMIARTGIGMAETFGKVTIERFVIPYWIDRRSDMGYILTYHDYNDIALRNLITNVTKYVCGLFEKQSGGRMPSISSALTKRERKIIDDIFSNRIPEFPERRYERGFSIRPATADDIPMKDMEHPDEPHLGPTFSRHGEFIPMKEMRSFRSDILKYRNVTKDERHEYVSSNSLGPITYRVMSEEQIDYYLYWRTLANERKYTDCDNGYLWLYLSELINLGEDEEETLQHIGDTFLVYDSWLAEKTYCEYALLNGLDIKIPAVCDSNVVVTMICLDHLFETGEGGPSFGGIFNLCCFDVSRKNAFADKDYGEVINRSMYLLNKEIGGFKKVYGIRPKTLVMHSYVDLMFLGTDAQRTASVKINNYAYNGEFLRELSTFINSVRQHMNGSSSGKYVNAFGRDCTRLVDSVIEDIEREKQSVIQRRLAASIELDSDSIMRAEDDLRSVSEMMAVSDEEEMQRTVEEDVPKGDGWDGFASSIDERCVSYLKDLLSGKKVKKDNRLEDAINDAAMDTVGDTLIENGILVEDYVDDLRGLLL